MEALQGVFPDIPVAVLRQVLEICDQSVEAASEWILEHDWRDLAAQDGTGEGPRREEEAGSAPAVEEEAARPQTVVVSTGTVAGALGGRERRRDGHGQQRFFARSSMLSARFDDSGGEQEGDSDEGDEEEDDDEDDEDEDDDDDDDDDEDDDEDGNAFFDAGDDAFAQNMLPPLAKRVKVAKGDDDKAGADGFWVAFDDVVVNKNLIELLNTTLSKLAHSRVVLLNQASGAIDPSTAVMKLRSVIAQKDTKDSPDAVEPSRPAANSGRISLSLLLNSSSPPAAISPVESKVSTLPSSGVVGQKRKRIDEDSATSRRGFFAHFFPVSDLDMIWRSVMHAHLFNKRFGETIEFHTASSGLFNRRDFDELMHLHSHSATSRASSLSLSPFTPLKCCLILPCAASDEEIFRVGKHLHSLLKLQGSLYYRTLDDPDSSEATTTGSADRRNSLSDLLGEDGKMTEDSFRRFARYRIKREESTATDTADDAGKHPADHFLGYERPRSVDYCLQILKTDGWDRQLSS